LTKRATGIKRATDKLTKEDNIQELSKKTLGSYVKKSVGDAIDTSKKLEIARIAHKQGLNSRYAIKDYTVKLTKRATGIKRATDKLTKEDNNNPSFKDDAKNYGRLVKKQAKSGLNSLKKKVSNLKTSFTKPLGGGVNYGIKEETTVSRRNKNTRDYRKNSEKYKDYGDYLSKKEWERAKKKKVRSSTWHDKFEKDT
ncbi:MAG: hypothetical protein WD512_11565, partial [Candidatus Paceibacterota bacterium]